MTAPDQTNAEVSDERLRELLPCPFCGLDLVHYELDHAPGPYYGHRNSDCPVGGFWLADSAANRSDLVAGWNRRSVTSQASEGAEWWKGGPEEFKLLYAATPEMIATSLEAQREKLTTLPENWDGYGAHPIVPQIVDTLLSEITVEGGVVDIVPGSDGSVQAEWHRHGVVDVEYNIGPDGKRELYVKVAPASPSKRVERLETALKPFADLNARLERDYPGYKDAVSVFFELTHGDFRRAFQALQGGRS